MLQLTARDDEGHLPLPDDDPIIWEATMTKLMCAALFLGKPP